MNPKPVKAFNGEEKQCLERIPISILNPKEKKSKKERKERKEQGAAH
jgi:hypothetical protein